MTELALAVAGHEVRITKPERVLWPAIGWTKLDLVTYLRAVAPALLPYLRGRAITLARFPQGIDERGWFQTNCPPGAPSWVRTVSLESPAGKALTMCLVEDEATLVWTANLGTIEHHPYLARVESPDAPDAMVLDLDPGAPAGLLECARVALALRARLDAMGLRAFAKTSGAKGLHVYVPLRGTTFERTKALARSLAGALRADDPARVTDRMAKADRVGRVLVDWMQNDPWRSTVAPYSLRATRVPLVSTPVTWDEIERAVGLEAPTTLRFGPDAVRARLAEHGDLFRPVLDARQRLP